METAEKERKSACLAIPRACAGLGDIIGFEPVVLITGHYGCGKTNLALNVALDAANAGLHVSVVDLDIVNPYFRSSDYKELLESKGIEVIAPVLAGSSVDVPSLSATVYGAIEAAQQDATGETLCLIDVGGDDQGARALGRFAEGIASGPYRMVHVINRYRNLTSEPAEAVEILREIETACGLQATSLVSNAHLRDDTDWDCIAAALPYADEVAELAGLPLCAVTIPYGLVMAHVDDILVQAQGRKFYPVEKLVTLPWE